MALTLEQARKIMRHARETFSERTVNKIFAKSSADPAPLPHPAGIKDARRLMEAEAESAGDDRRRELEKAIARNRTAGDAIRSHLRRENPARSSGTPYSRGAEMHDRGCAGGRRQTGNCTEQAEVAAYLAILADEANRGTTYLVEVTAPGNHLFCVVGATRQPVWRTVEEMGQGRSGLAVVIDPWMHFACYAAEYPLFAAGKLQQWLARGKRIAWMGNDRESPGWYQPAGDYAARFRDSPLSYEPAG